MSFEPILRFRRGYLPRTGVCMITIRAGKKSALQARIFLGPEILIALHLQRGDYVKLDLGSGSDQGVVRITKTDSQDYRCAYKLGHTGTGGHGGVVCLASLASRQVHPTIQLEHHIEQQSLYIKLAK